MWLVDLIREMDKMENKFFIVVDDAGDRLGIKYDTKEAAIEGAKGRISSYDELFVMEVVALVAEPQKPVVVTYL